MSLVEEETWGHRLDELAKEIAERRAAGRALRVWLLNPSKNVIEQLGVSTYFMDIWRDYGLVQPYVTLPVDSMPQADVLISDPLVPGQEPRDEGDTGRARDLLVKTLKRTLQGLEADTEAFLGLDDDERHWVDMALERNNAIVVSATPDAKGQLMPAFDLEKLAFEAVTLLAPRTLATEVRRVLREQKAARCVFQLPSKGTATYCTEYVPPTIIRTLPEPTIAAVNEWVERQVSESGAQYAISFSGYAKDRLALAARANRNIRLMQVQHYLPELPELETIPPGSTAVILALISGAARTLENVARRLRERGVAATVVCVIDTTTDEDRRPLEALGALG